MERDRENLWSRRPNTNKLSLSVSKSDSQDGKGDQALRSFSGSKRFGNDSSSHGRSNPFNSMAPLAPATIASPTAGGSTAFGFGSGAFASFGSSSKTSKTPGTAADFSKVASGTVTPSATGDKREKQFGRVAETGATEVDDSKDGSSVEHSIPWPLKHAWVVWYRPPTSKNSDYEKSIKPMCRMETAQDFWSVYIHLKRPSGLPTVSDYHFFKEGVRPVWEDEANKRGGKWILRLKKGVADRYWEDLLLAMVGDQFYEAGEEVCGAVLSVRSGEDVFSIWTRNDGGRNIKIRETVKRILALPSDTQIIWKSHDDSIAQRTAIDQARHEKTGHHTTDKRRTTQSSDEAPFNKEKA